MINPLLIEAYERYKGVGLDFWESMQHHLMCGYVLVTPREVCLARWHGKDLFVEYIASDRGKMRSISDLCDSLGLEPENICYHRGFKNKSDHTIEYRRLRAILRKGA